jgi:YaiO family outer membrane protein
MEERSVTLRHGSGLRPRLFHVILLLLLWTSSLQSQERFDPDALFREARGLGFGGRHAEARQLCLKILEQYPDYSDVGIFLGRLQSWDGQYDDARKTLLDVLSRTPESQDARSALIDVELWSGNPSRALEQTEAGLRSSPADETLLYRKALALRDLNRQNEAAESLERILELDPLNRDARSLMENFKDSGRLYELRIDYGYDRLPSSLSPWHESSVSLSRETSFGPVVGRVSYASRFSINAYQYEVEMYPGLRRGLHAYVSYGYSPTAIFPRHRGGVELFSNPGKGFEVSGGLRYLRFSENVWIYTGSAGKYIGDYFVSFRPFVTPGTAGTSLSGTLTFRRYYGDSDSYLGIHVGAGSAPDDGLSTVELERLNSFKIGASGSLPVGHGAYWTFSAGWNSEKLPFDNHRNRSSLGTGLIKRF